MSTKHNIYGSLHVNDNITGDTLNILTVNNNNSLTQILGKNSVSGNVEYIDVSSIVGSVSADTYVVSGNADSATSQLSFTYNTGGTFTVANSAALFSDNDINVTGGTYNPSTGCVTFATNSGTTFDVCGFVTGITDSYTTGSTLVGESIQFDNNILGSNYYNVNLTPALSGKTNLSLFNSHTANTVNPHQTSFGNLVSTAHTHSISEVINLQSELDDKLDVSAFNSYSGDVSNQLSAKIENGINLGSANEIFSGKSGTDFYFRTISGGTNATITTVGGIVNIDVETDITRVQGGTNITTGGTVNSPIVSLDSDISLNSVSATNLSGGTLYSGSTDLSDIFLTTNDGNDITRVSGGINISTGGTANNPTVNLDDDILLSSVSATTLSGGTIYSGSTDLSDIFLTTADGNDITRVQPGTNITTGGTANNPIINVDDSPVFNSLITSGQTTINSNFTVTGNTLISGTTTIGNDLEPNVDNIVDLGAPSLRWREIYTTNLDATNAVTANSLYAGFEIESPSISGTSVSATTFYSGSTDLSDIFLTTADGNDITRVQPGNNINTGGTANNPIVNLDDDISLISVSATTISGGTFYGDGSNLSGINDFYLTGQTFNNSNYILTSSLNDGSVLNSDLSVLASDIFVISGVYSPSTGVVTYTNSSGGTFNVGGFTTGMTDSYTNAANLNGNLIEFDNNIQGSNFYNVDLSPALSAFTTGDTFVTGFTYNNANTFTISRNDGVTLSSTIESVTGLTVDGIFSASTYTGITLNSLDDVTSNIPATPDNSYQGRMMYFDVASNEWLTTEEYVSTGTVTIWGKKGSAGTIDKGLPVYIVGFDNDIHEVELANSSTGTTMPVIGFTSESFDNTNTNPIVTFGKLTGINTSSGTTTLNPNGETWVINDELYVSTTTGGLTKVRPTGSDTQIQRIAKVLKVGTVDGQLFAFNTARTAGLPNLTTDYLWVGNGSDTPQEVIRTDVGITTTGFTYNDNNTFTITDDNGGSLSSTINQVSGLTTTNFINYANTTDPLAVSGRTYYDVSENALSYFPETPNMDVTINIGQEGVTRVYNNTGIQINNGQACHLSGEFNGVATVKLAIASGTTDTSDTSYEVTGIATHNIPNGTTGFITNIGLVRDLNITGTTPGSAIFLSDQIAGKLVYELPTTNSSRISQIGYVIATGTTTGRILVELSNESVSVLSTKEIDVLTQNNASTGTRNGGFMTVNGGDNSKFDISAGSGTVMDNFTDANTPLLTEVVWDTITGVTLTSLTGSQGTYIFINSSGGTLQFPLQTPPQQSDKRDNIFLGIIGHASNTVVNNIFNTPIQVVSPINQLEDLTSSIGPFSKSGNRVSNITGTLELQKSSGNSFVFGGNLSNNNKIPSNIQSGVLSGSTLVYAKGTAVLGQSGTTVDVQNYDSNGLGTISSIPGSNYVATRIWHAPINNVLVFQYAQFSYSTQSLARDSFPNENYTSPPGLDVNAYLVAVLIYKKGDVNLDNALVIPQGKFAGTGGGGTSPDTLQSVYDNSIPNPEILTDATNESVDFRVGSGSDSDNLIRFQQNDGTVNAFITGEGNSSFNNISGDTLQLNTVALNPTGTDILVRNSTTGVVDYRPVSGITPDLNTFVSGGTYNDTTNNINFSGNSTETTFDVDLTGLVSSVSGDTFVVGGTYVDSTNTIALLRNDGNFVNVTGVTNTYVTGGTINLPATDNSNGGTIGLLYKDSDGIPRTLPFEDTYTSGTTFASNQATLTRNDGTEIFKLSGGTNVTLSNPSTNQIKLDVTIPAGMNTYVTGFTYDDANTLTISDNVGDTFPVTINTMTGLTVSGKVITTQLQVTSSPTNGYVLTSDASGNANWQAAGGGPTLRNVSSTDTFSTANETINCTSGTFIINLPTAVGIQGTTYTLVNSGTGVITLDANGTETINGSLTIDLSTQYISRTVQSDGANWIVI